MNDKERLETIKNSVKPMRENVKYVLVSSENVKWLIEQAEKMIKVREIYENGGEDWQDYAENMIFDALEISEGLCQALEGETDESSN